MQAAQKKVKVLLLALTGISAINILGTAINSGLAIQINNSGSLPRMFDQNKCKLRNLSS